MSKLPIPCPWRGFTGEQELKILNGRRVGHSKGAADRIGACCRSTDGCEYVVGLNLNCKQKTDVSRGTRVIQAVECVCYDGAKVWSNKRAATIDS